MIFICFFGCLLSSVFMQIPLPQSSAFQTSLNLMQSIIKSAAGTPLPETSALQKPDILSLAEEHDLAVDITFDIRVVFHLTG